MSFTDAQIAEFKDAFSVFDADRSGRISVRELASVMRSLGHTISESEAKEMVNEVDEDGSGSLSFPEFLRLMAGKIKAIKEEDALHRSFASFDKDGNGFISFAELQRGMRESGYDLPYETLRDMMSAADKNGDGRVNYREFVTMMMAQRKRTY